MTQDMKNFIYASIVYLGLAAIFGMLNGMTDIGYWGVFAHTHFNLLGFMSMMVFGVGYFILPRFNGTELRFPGLIKIHLWLGNISLIGLVTFRGLEVQTGESIYANLFIIMAVVQIITIFMFIVNIWLSLSPAKVAEPEPTVKKEAPKAEPMIKPDFALNGDTKISDIIDLKPSLIETLSNEGLVALSLPGHVDKVRKMGITIGLAAQNHNLDLNKLLTIIGKELNIQESNKSKEADINSETLIGDILKNYPASKNVFQKHFGDGCFDCPGQSYESVDLACRMHGIDSNQFLQELQTALKG